MKNQKEGRLCKGIEKFSGISIDDIVLKGSYSIP
jgi:hypothetical protein